MTDSGFTGEILQVNLTSGRISVAPLDLGLARKFVGGLGLAIRLAADYIQPGTDPLAPENPIILSVGPLVGTGVPSSSRVYGVTKLPASGTIGWCGAGGVTFGYQLKQAGFDLIVLTGRAERPVMLVIEDGQARLVEADHLWGQGVIQTAETLWRKSPWPTGVLTIGPAGENRSSLAMAYINRIATLGRGGFGGVLGSKNLKAIVVRGSAGVRVADPKRTRALIKALLTRIREYPYLKEWQQLGMIKSFPIVPVEYYQQIKKQRVACVSCPTGCKDVVQIPDGRFSGFTAWSSSVVNLYTPVSYGIKDYGQAVRLVAELDEYGLDMFEFFGVMKTAANLVERGVVALEAAEPKITPDSFESMFAWAGRVARREGLGAVLADGFNGLMAAWGDAAREASPALIKGMHPYAGPGSALPWDLFGTMELGQVMDPRGPHVGSGGSPTYFAKRPIEVFPRHLKRMGVPEETIHRILTGPELQVGRLLKYSHNWFSLLGCLGICARAQINRFYNAELCTEFYEAVTGFETNLAELRLGVDRVWTLLRLLNLRDGFDRQVKEVPPNHWIKEQGFKEYLSEKPLSPQEVHQMIEDYYDEWGWERTTGRPTPAIIEKLGLGEFI